MERPILCVDDDGNMLDRLTDMLEAAGFPVLVAQTGYDALALILSNRPALVLLDLVLPDLPGEEVCRRLRAHGPTADIPVIMLTVKGDESDKVIGFETGADDYVTKPFSDQVLLARIRALLRRHELSR